MVRPTVGANTTGVHPGNETASQITCTGTTTIFGSEPTMTYTVTETYWSTTYGPMTESAPPPVTTSLPFCGTVVHFTTTKNASTTRSCTGDDICATLVFGSTESPTVAFATTTETVSITWKVPDPNVANVVPTHSVDFGPAVAVAPQPIQTGAEMGDPASERNSEAQSTPKPSPSGKLGGIIASMINSPYRPPRPSPSPPAGVPNPGPPGSGSPNNQNPGSPGPGSPNNQNPPAGVPNHTPNSNTSPSQGTNGGAVPNPAPFQPKGPIFEVVTKSVIVSIAPSGIVIEGETIPAGAGSSTLAIHGQVISINPSQVIASGITINFPPPASAGAAAGSPSPVNVFFAIESNAVVIGGQSFTAGSSPTSTVINGQAFAVNPSQRNNLGSSATPAVTTPQFMTVADVPMAIQSGRVVIGGQTFSRATTTITAVINGQTFTINPSQVVAPGTTIDLPSAVSITTLSGVTAAGLTFSVGPSIAIISGTTYAIGAAASPTTRVIGGQTISFGPDGVGFASTTIPAPTAPATTTATPGLEIFVGRASGLGVDGAALGTILAFGLCLLLLL